MKSRGEFSKRSPFNYQSHQSLSKFRNVPVEDRAQEITQEIFKVKLKGQDSKLVARTAPTKEDDSKDLKRHIKMLEAELKKKILDNPILNRLLKTKHNSELSHVDLYLEFVRLREAQSQVEEQLQRANGEKEEFKQKVEHLHQEMARRQQEFVQELQHAGEKFSQLQAEFQSKVRAKEDLFEQETVEREGKVEQMDCLIEELKSKSKALSKQMKENELSFSQKSAHFKSQIEQLKEKINRQNSSFTDAKKQLSIKIRKLQEDVKQKNSTIQELNRFIDLQNSEQQKRQKESKGKFEQKFVELSRKYESQILALQKSHSQQIENVYAQFESKEQRWSSSIGHKQRQFEQKLQELTSTLEIKERLIVELQNKSQRLEEEFNASKKQYQGELIALKQAHSSLLDEKQNLIKQLFETQKELNSKSDALQNLTYENAELSNMCHKGQNDRQREDKYKCSVIDTLEKKIFLLGHENTKLKQESEAKKKADQKAYDMKKISEKEYSQKYKSIGRVEEINHKLTMFLQKQTPMPFTSPKESKFIAQATEDFSLVGNLNTLSELIENVFEAYHEVQKSREAILKAKHENESQFESILNHFLDNIGDHPVLEEFIQQYVQAIRQENSTLQNFALLQEEKNEVYQEIIKNLLSMKIIQSYSSAQSTLQTNRYHSSYDEGTTTRQMQKHTKNQGRIPSEKAAYSSNPNSDSLQGSLKRMLFQSYNYQNNTSSRIKQYHKKSKARFSTESMSMDVDEHSVFQIAKQNCNEQNLILKSSKGKKLDNSSLKERIKSTEKGKTFRKPCINDSSYKHQVRQLLQSRKKDREMRPNKRNIKDIVQGKESYQCSNKHQISKEDIENKYFLR